MVSLVSCIFLLVLLLALGFFWRSRRARTVELSDVDARRKAAAQWLADGEGAEAERMLRAAVEALEAWPKALAESDLADLLAASGRRA